MVDDLSCSAIVSKMAESEIDCMIQQFVETRVGGTPGSPVEPINLTPHLPLCRILASWSSWETSVCVQADPSPRPRVSHLQALHGRHWLLIISIPLDNILEKLVKRHGEVQTFTETRLT